MGLYEQTCGRVRVQVSREGARQQGYGYGATVACRGGWNDACPMVELTMSVEELHDLRYLIDRAIVAADRVLQGEKS